MADRKDSTSGQYRTRYTGKLVPGANPYGYIKGRDYMEDLSDLVARRKGREGTWKLPSRNPFYKEDDPRTERDESEELRRSLERKLMTEFLNTMLTEAEMDQWGKKYAEGWYQGLPDSPPPPNHYEGVPSSRVEAEGAGGDEAYWNIVNR